MDKVLKVFDAISEGAYHAYAIWDCVNRDDFTDAMTQQFYALMYRDIVEDSIESLSKEDRDMYLEMQRLVYE